MLIRSISMENFQCYAGSLDENTFEFSKGLNVIIGDNGSGKSKLYDAFFWVLYDKIFNSSIRIMESTSHVGINLVSDKAKSKCEVGDFIEARVKLVLEDDKPNSAYSDEYILERSFKITKVKESKDFNDSAAWKVDSNSKTTIDKKDIIDFKPVYAHNAFERIANKLLPNDMKPYLWFQGEQVDSLIDFKNNNSLTEAINVLSDISHYDFLIEVANKVYLQAEKAYRSELLKKSKSSVSAEENQKEQDRLEKKINQDKTDLISTKKNLDLAKEAKDELLGRIGDAQELEKLKVEMSASEDKLRSVNSRIEKARKNFNSNLFSKQWILRNGSSYAEKFEKMLSNYDEKREDQKIKYKIELQQEEAIKNRLPENVPNKTYLKAMLDEQQCFLCDRGFEEGDHAHVYINEILEKTKSNHVRYTDFLQNDLKKHYQNLYNNAYYINENVIPGIDVSIQKELERMDLMDDEKSSLAEDFKELDEKFKHLLATSKISQEDSQNIVNSFRQNDYSKDRFKEEEFQINQRLKSNEEALAAILLKLKESLGSDIDPEILEKKEVLEVFKNLSISTRDLVYEEQIKKIEKEANKHFQKMTEENKSVRGKIILERRGDSYMPKNIDDNGVELTSINDSNIILIKLATIMAIVTAKGGSDNHPLISDAPTSKFSDNYTLGFCKTISEVFTQSIIISYDFYHNTDLRERLLKEVSNLGSVYIIEPSITETERMNRTELSTHATVLN